MAEFLKKSRPKAQREAWRRDIDAWLAGTQAATPEKIRRFCQALGFSWIVGLMDAGYAQHPVALIDQCLQKGAFEIARIIAQRSLTSWRNCVDDTTKVFALSKLDDEILAAEEWLANPRVPGWKRIPGRVSATRKTHVAVRAALRLLDGEEVRFLVGNLASLSWPPLILDRHAQDLIGSAFAELTGEDPFTQQAITLRYSPVSRGQ